MPLIVQVITQQIFPEPAEISWKNIHNNSSVFSTTIPWHEALSSVENACNLMRLFLIEVSATSSQILNIWFQKKNASSGVELPRNVSFSHHKKHSRKHGNLIVYNFKIEILK